MHLPLVLLPVWARECFGVEYRQKYLVEAKGVKHEAYGDFPVLLRRCVVLPHSAFV